MIYTVTVNPSLDYIVEVKSFELGMTNRTDTEKILPGGKGINVSMVLKNLGYESTALGFVAGFTGDELIRKLEEKGIHQEFIRIPEGFTRINLKLKNIDGTEINGQGPYISPRYIQQLLERLKTLQEGDILFLSGSIPGTMPQDFYKQIMEELEGQGIMVIVDATKELLTKVLPYHPFLIKPNNHELGEIFGVKLVTREEVIPYGRKLQEMGAKNVLISMAGEGSVLIAEDGSVVSKGAPKGILVNGVGAGDSMVAGFVVGFLEKHDFTYAYQMGASTGSASAFSENLATREEVEEVMRRTF